MRRVCLSFAALVVLVLAVSGVVEAQTEGGPPRIVDITKVVEGDGPVGGYVVELTCTFPQGGSPVVEQVTFDSAGPDDSQTISVPAPNDDGVRCTVVEIDDQGAETVTYQCVDGAPDQTCIDDQTVEIQTVNDFSSSGFVVTNTFPVDDEPAPPIDTDDDVVVATPTYTG